MNADARITLYGGVAIGGLVTAVGLACHCQILKHTGFGLLGTTLLLTAVVDHSAPGPDAADA